jgi:acyl carrier protein
MNNVDTRLKNIIINNSKKVIDLSEICTNTNIVDAFGFDSMLLIQMIVDIESEFGIIIEDEDMEMDKLSSYGFLYNLINNKFEAN